MSFQITGPGFYRQRNGCKAEVIGKGSDGRWYGAENSPAPCCSVWMDSGAFACDGPEGATDIVSAWHDPPTPPDGFQLMPRDYVAKKGDKVSTEWNRDWSTVVAWTGKSTNDIEGQCSQRAPVYIASPIPKPFRISDHG